jgi:hypothetical protein
MAKRNHSARRPRTAIEARQWSQRKLAAIETHARQRCEEMMGFFDEGVVSTVLEDMLVDIANSVAEVLERLDEEVAQAAAGDAE